MKEILLQEISENEFKELISETMRQELINYIKAPENPKSTEFITRQETARFLKISLNSLNDWTKKGFIPAYRIGNRVRYKRHEVEQSLKTVQTLKYRR